MLHIIVFSFHSKAKMLDNAKVYNSSGIGSNVQQPTISRTRRHVRRHSSINFNLIQTICSILFHN